MTSQGTVKDQTHRDISVLGTSQTHLQINDRAGFEDAILIRWNKVFSSSIAEHYSSSVTHWASSWLVKDSDEGE